MKTRIFSAFVSMFFMIAIVTPSCTTSEQEKQASEKPNIEGTYKLVSGKLSDETTQLSPDDIMGLMTFTKTHINFNFMAIDTEGKVTSVSYVATYKLTSTEYTETNICYVAHDQIRNAMTGYDFTKETGTSPVKIENGRIEFVLPLHNMTSVVIEGETITSEGSDFVFIWEKVT